MIFKSHVFVLYSYLCIYIATHLNTVYLDWLQAVLESNSRCASKWWLSDLRGICRGRDQESLEMQFGGHDRASVEMHLEAAIRQVWRCNWRPWLSDIGDALGGRNWASFKIRLMPLIERLWRCTWRVWSSEFGDALWRPRSSEFGDRLGGRDWASLEMQLQAVIERHWRCTWRS